MESIQLTTIDGHELAADIAHADGAPRGGVVVCHPHPQYGGNRFSPVVQALFDHLPTRGYTAVRFDFRSDFDNGVGERNDVIAALDHLASIDAGPLAVAGYSFGAAVALNTLDNRITAIAAIAPPLAMMTVTTPTVPTLVQSPAHDQFTDPAAAAEATSTWSDCTLVAVESADHFLVGHAASVARATGDWLLAQH